MLVHTEVQSDKLTEEIRAEIREEDKQMVMQFRNELPPTITGVLELERKEWLKQGIEQGIEQQKMATARNLIVLAMDDELIVKVTGLSVEQVEILRSEM